MPTIVTYGLGSSLVTFIDPKLSVTIFVTDILISAFSKLYFLVKKLALLKAQVFYSLGKFPAQIMEFQFL